MSDIVKMKGGDVFTDTLIISEGVGIEHRAVMSLLKKHSSRETLSTFQMSKVSRGGRPVEYAILNEEQTTFLITLMRNSDKVIQFKEVLTKAFFTQRRMLAQISANQTDSQWKQARSDGKTMLLQKTDSIKKFVDYAIDQGSTSAKRYYGNISTMQNKALFVFEQKYKNMREVLTVKQLMLASTCDTVVENALIEGMSQGLHYKDCFKLAKDRVIAYSKLVGVSPVVQVQGVAAIDHNEI